MDSDVGRCTSDPTAFLCHSSDDKHLVRQVATWLRASGIHVWIDEVQLHVGESLIDRIATAIHKSDVILAFISQRSVASSWVQKELSLAMTREVHGKRIRVLPIRIDNCELPYSLRDKLYADLRDSSLRPRELERLSRAIDHFVRDAADEQSSAVPGAPGALEPGAVVHNRGDSFQGFRIAKTNKTFGVFLMVLGVAIALAALVIGLLMKHAQVAYSLLAAAACTLGGGSLLALSGALFEQAFDGDRNLLLELEARGGYWPVFSCRWRELYRISARNKCHRLGLLFETAAQLLLVGGMVLILVAVKVFL